MLSILRRRRLRKQKAAPAARAGAKIRLHLGSGGDYWPGYVNVDADPSATCDLRIDFTRIEEVYPPGSVSEVAMIHSLSYLSLWQARDLFAALHRLFEPGGRLIVEFPDLAKCARAVLDHEYDFTAYLEAVRAIYAFDLSQIERRQPYTPYAFGWSASHLIAELQQAGFREVALLDPQTHGPRPWRDARVEAIK